MVQPIVDAFSKISFSVSQSIIKIFFSEKIILHLGNAEKSSAILSLNSLQSSNQYNIYY
jgi:hypothetical protein